MYIGAPAVQSTLEMATKMLFYFNLFSFFFPQDILVCLASSFYTKAP